MSDTLSAAVPFWTRLTDHGARVALLDGAQRLSYGELCAAADAWHAAARKTVAPARPLVLIAMENRRGAVTAYLGALRAGWPVIATAPAQVATLARRFRPNLICTGTDDWLARPADPGPRKLHPELALMLSTSGSTGSPKLVRLSRRNIAANAEAIAQYLKLAPEDRSITTLPLHYSYGLSVLHSLFWIGGALRLSTDGLQAPGFWNTARQDGVTSLALVPAQFQLCDMARVKTRLPQLRYVTQAGGRLDRETLARVGAASRQAGWDLIVMYGQTEAAPRMAWMPPEKLAGREDQIGQAIPGGRFEILAEDGALITRPGVSGSLIYHGPNVMMGYAERRADLALPPGPDRLETGDLAEWSADGFLRLTGRSSRFVKIAGLRIGLDEVERLLEAEGVRAVAVPVGDDILALATTSPPPDRLADDLARRFGIPAQSIQIAQLAEIPHLSNGKIDYRGLTRSFQNPPVADPDLAAELSRILGGIPLDLRRSFAAHGGDSLAHLSAQLVLGRAGGLPRDWEQLPLAQLLGRNARAPKGLLPLPGETALRVLAIAMVLALHATALPLGGATLALFVLAGATLARFKTQALAAGQGLRVLREMLAPLLLGYAGVMVFLTLFRGLPDPVWFTLTANFHPGAALGVLQPYWFVASYAQVIALLCLLSLLPVLRGALARNPLRCGAVAIALSVAAMGATGLLDAPILVQYRHPLGALQFVLAGWCLFHAARSGRVLATVLLVGYALTGALLWDDLSPSATAILVLTGLVVAFDLRVPAPMRLFHAATWIARHTLLIYLLHPLVLALVWPHTDPGLLRFSATVIGTLAIAAFIQAGFSHGLHWRVLFGREKTGHGARTAGPGGQQL